MKIEKEKLLLQSLLNHLKTDIKLGLRNLAVKSSLDTKNDVVNIIGTDEKEQVLEAKKFVKDSTDIIVREAIEKIDKFFDEYLID